MFDSMRISYIFIYIHLCVCACQSLSHVTLCNTMGYSSPGSSAHGIFQARILERVAISFSRGSSWPREQTRVSRIAGRFFAVWATREALIYIYLKIYIWNIYIYISASFAVYLKHCKSTVFHFLKRKKIIIPSLLKIFSFPFQLIVLPTQRQPLFWFLSPQIYFARPWTSHTRGSYLRSCCVWLLLLSLMLLRFIQCYFYLVTFISSYFLLLLNNILFYGCISQFVYGCFSVGEYWFSWHFLVIMNKAFKNILLQVF